MPDSLVLVSIVAALVAFVLAAVLGRILVPWIDGLRLGQQVRELGPKSHYVKSGTPTFGGFIFMIPIALVALFFALRYPEMRALLPLLAYALVMMATGFADDYVKVRIDRKGLSPLAKSIPMAVGTVVFLIWYLGAWQTDVVFVVPFTRHVLHIAGWLRLPYGIFAFLYLYFVANSVNITDGVDGLLSSVSIPVAILFGIAGARIGFEGAQGFAPLGLGIAGALAGFLLVNRHPARIFMGDTGSLALGGLLAAMALILGSPWAFLLAGLIYTVESMSVIIQRLYFKRTGGKRIFRMSPVHHHYELGGWSERRIVLSFTLFTVAMTLINALAWWALLR